MAYQINKFKYHSCYQGDEGLVLSFEEGAGETFKEGDLVKLASGLAVIATKSSTDLILGFALKDASGVTNQTLPVQVIRPSDVFIMPLDGDDTFVIANVGNVYETEVANARWEVNIDGTTATEKVCWVLGSLEYNLAGTLAATAGGPVYVRFNASNLEFSRDD